MDCNKIGSFIIKRRKAKNLTQNELAQKLYVTDRAVSKWECGKGLPDVSIMPSLCELLGISITELLNGENIAEKEATSMAEKQIVEQLQEQGKSKKKMHISSIMSLIVTTIILPLMMVGNFLPDNVTKILFNIVCIAIMATCIIISTALGLPLNKNQKKKSND